MKILLFLIPIILLTLISCNASDAELRRAKIYTANGLQTVVNNEYVRGQEKIEILREYAEDKSQRNLQSKSIKIFNSVMEIDADATGVIRFLENAKLWMFHSMGLTKKEMISNEMLTRAYTYKEPLTPSRYDLGKCDLTESTDILDPEGEFGKELINQFENFRGSICERIVSSVLVEKGYKPYYFKDPLIREFTDTKELYKRIDAAITSSHVAQDDSEALKKIYGMLSHNKQGWSELMVKDIYWVDAFTILTQLEMDVLSARADAVSLIRARIGCGGCYGFDSILPMAFGPEVAREGENVYIDVLMVAFDSYEQPEVEADGAQVVRIKDGKARLKVELDRPGEKVAKGTITIRNKSGIPKTMSWRKRIVVLPGKTITKRSGNMYRN